MMLCMKGCFEAWRGGRCGINVMASNLVERVLRSTAGLVLTGSEPPGVLQPFCILDREIWC